MWKTHYDPEDIQKLFLENRWREIFLHYSPVAVSRTLGLENATALAQYLINDTSSEPIVRENAIALFYITKAMF